MAATGEYRFSLVQLSEGWSGRVLVECAGPWAPILLPAVSAGRDWLEQLVRDRASLSGYRVLKYSSTAEVAEALGPWNGAPEAGSSMRVVCRRGLAEGWERLRATRPRRNFARAMTLLRCGVGTARPLALIERRRSRESWLVTEFLSDMMDLDQMVLRLSSMPPAQIRSVKGSLIESVASLLAALDRAGLTHRDMKASNILISQDSDAEPFGARIVDLDGLHRRRWGKRRQPLVRLAASVLDAPSLTQSDFLRFLRQYLALTSPARDDWKSLFRRSARQARQYAERSTRRKGGKLDGYTG